MKLYLNQTSPYARLTLVTAHEAGVSDRIEKIYVEPWNDPPELLAIHPLAKVPALVTDDGTVLVESTGICDYLIAYAGRTELLPPQMPARSRTLRRLGLARASIDCAFGVVIQRRFNGNRDTPLSERWLRALPRAAVVLDAIANERLAGPQVDIGDVAVAVAFQYLDFRLRQIDWRTAAPRLAQWVDRVGARASMQATQPR